jgi:ankyrin repeat protein
MTTGCENDELFREASCNGDIESLNKFLEVFAVDINCTNKVNGWTALHHLRLAYSDRSNCSDTVVLFLCCFVQYFQKREAQVGYTERQGLPNNLV